MSGLIALPARYRGLGLRRMDDFVGAAAAIGGWDMVSRNLIGRTDVEEIRREALYPLLLSVFGENSQDPENLDTRSFQASRGAPISRHHEALQPTSTQATCGKLLTLTA